MTRSFALCLAALLGACAASHPGGSKQPSQPATSTSAQASAPAPSTAPSAQTGAPNAAAGRSGAPLAPEGFGPTDSSQDFRAPWSVTRTRLADNRWMIWMRKRAWTMGGDGESVALLHEYARVLAHQQGYREYVILSMTEGVQSDMPIGYRWARAEVLLRAAEPPMPES